MGSIVASLLIAEAGLRLIGFKYPLYPERIEFGYPDPVTMANLYRQDRYLFWTPPDYYERLQEAQGVAMVFLGDSCTQISYYDQYLARRAEQAFPGQCLSYWNAGVSGWTSYQGRLQLERDVLPLQPKVVTFYFGWNDHWIGFGLEDKDVHGIVASPLFPVRNSRLVQLVQKVYIVSAPDDGEALPKRVSLDDFRANLSAMVTLCKKAGVTPLLVTAPTSARPGSEPLHLEGRWLENRADMIPLHNQYVDAVREVANALDAPLCDLAAWADDLPDGEVRQYFTEDTIHFNPEGSRVIAEKLFEAIEGLGMWDSLMAPGEACVQLHGMPHALRTE